MTDEIAAVSRALGLHHTLVTAIADLVDNCIDAGARHVLIRFVQSGRLIQGVQIVDDGHGMTRATMESAVLYGVGRLHDDRDHGHFGVGMKAASFSQANELAVYSHGAGSDSAACRLSVTGRHDAPVVEWLPTGVAEDVLAEMKPRFPFTSGTIVEWRGVRTFPLSASTDEQVEWLETAINDVQVWLGLVFHRLLDAGLTITIDVFDAAVSRPGAPRLVRAIDPFGYRRSGAVGYPRVVELGIGMSMTLHVWPARAGGLEFKIGGSPGREAQGFFVYRNDRLLNCGGWLGVLRPRPEWALARVEIDLNQVLSDHVTINPEKAGVVFDATITAALYEVLTAGYLEDAARVLKVARRGEHKPITVVEPGAGLPDEVADEFADTFTFSETADPVDIGWRVLKADQFFDVDLDNRALWINSRYRRRLGGRKQSDVEVPLLRTLVFLLTQDMFDVVRHSARQSEQIAAWQRVLIAAMVAEEVDGR
ncbi:MAG: ATP-binding protein [Gordonia sp. (in: high G+C Gram-positive bacteria)]